MNEKRLNEGARFDDELLDERLERALKGAYDAMDPTPEQEQRMLEALMEAQSLRKTERDAAERPNASESPATSAAPESPATSEASAASEAPESPAASEASAACEAPESPATSESPAVSAASESSAAGDAAEHSGASELAAASEAPAAREAPESPATSEASAACEAPESSAAPATSAVAAASPSPNRSRFKLWKVAVPLAACLALGAVVIGVAGSSTPNETVTGSDAPKEAVTEKSTTAGVANTADPKTTMNAKGTTEGVEDTGAVDIAAEDNAFVEELDRPLAAQGTMAAGTESYAGPGSFGVDEFNTEEYDALKETGFISTLTNPLSTVSADVDTASYCNVRRMIRDGWKLSEIPSGAVRIEEMLNYFDYGYTTPTGSDLFSMQAQSAPCPWNPDTQLLVMGFATAEENQAASKGSNLVFLIDVSGSMNSPDKLDLLQDSFATLLESLDGNDRVSIVTYASGEEIVLDGARGDDDKAILKAIYKLRADGSTNGEAGLKQAYEVASRNYIEGGVNRIIMASDGDLNVGITSESELYDFVDGKRDSGIYLSVLGFGSGNYKDNKMETLADHGNGSYHYIDSTEEAERVLKEKLTANLVPFADNVKLQLEFNPAQVKAYRLIGYENRELADEDFRNDAVDAGDVGPGSQFTVAYEIVLADSSFEVEQSELKYGSPEPYGNASSDWLTCSMRYHVFDGDEMREQELVVDAASSQPDPSADWNLAAAVIEFGMLARDSEYAGSSNEDSVLDLLSKAGSGDQVDSFRRLVVMADVDGRQTDDAPDGRPDDLPDEDTVVLDGNDLA